MRAFITIWAGQFVSRIGTATTRFALLVGAYEQTGSASAVALFAFFSFVPFIVVSPFAGVWVDRMDRRWIMALADTAAGVMTIALLLLYTGGDLRHLPCLGRTAFKQVYYRAPLMCHSGALCDNTYMSFQYAGSNADPAGFSFAT